MRICSNFFFKQKHFFFFSHFFKALSYEMSAIIRPSVRVTRNSVPLGEPITVECTLFSDLLHVPFLSPFSFLFQDLQIDSLLIKFAEGSHKFFKIPLLNVNIPPGKSVFHLSEEAAIIGEYCVERVIVQIGQLMLSYTMFPEENLKVSVTVSKPSVVLDVQTKGKKKMAGKKKIV